MLHAGCAVVVGAGSSSVVVMTMIAGRPCPSVVLLLRLLLLLLSPFVVSWRWRLGCLLEEAVAVTRTVLMGAEWVCLLARSPS